MSLLLVPVSSLHSPKLCVHAPAVCWLHATLLSSLRPKDRNLFNYLATLKLSWWKNLLVNLKVPCSRLLADTPGGFSDWDCLLTAKTAERWHWWQAPEFEPTDSTRWTNGSFNTHSHHPLSQTLCVHAFSVHLSLSSSKEGWFSFSVDPTNPRSTLFSSTCHFVVK